MSGVESQGWLAASSPFISLFIGGVERVDLDAFQGNMASSKANSQSLVLYVQESAAEWCLECLGHVSDSLRMKIITADSCSSYLLLVKGRIKIEVWMV